MQKRKLGNSELMVSPLAFGGNVLGWTIAEKTAFEVLDAFEASGCNFIDTADIYARWATGVGGESETMLGNWFKKRGNRQHIVLATKVGKDMGGQKKGLSKKYILNAVDASLKRLQTDYIDLYQSHDDDETVPMEESLEAFQQLMKEGKIRYIGASNFSAARLQKAIETSEKKKLPAYQSLQPHYNLLERKTFETEFEPFCLRHNIGVINYFPLASGFLTGKYRSEADLTKSIRGGSLGRFLNPKGLGILRALDEVAEKHHTNPASACLAWYMARPSITAPIASATSLEQVKQLTNAINLQLDKQDIDLLDTCSKY